MTALGSLGSGTSLEELGAGGGDTTTLRLGSLLPFCAHPLLPEEDAVGTARLSLLSPCLSYMLLCLPCFDGLYIPASVSQDKPFPIGLFRDLSFFILFFFF